MRLLVVFAVLVLAGCGGHGQPTAPGSVAPAGSPPSVIPSASDDPPGSLACARLATAIGAGSFMTPGVVDTIVAASASADAPLADSAARLEDAYRTAVAAAGKPDEPDKIAAVAAAASDMSGVCAESGLRTAG